VSRFYVPNKCIKENHIFVNGDEAHHILNVMRLKKGDEIVAFDGTEKEYTGIIEKTEGSSVVIKIKETRENHNLKNYKVTLAQAIPKRDKMDYIIQKSTELGVDTIIPMITKRTIVKVKPDKISGKISRWETIAKEAAKQCGRTTIPVIDSPKHFKALLKSAGSYDLVLAFSVAHLKKRHLKDILHSFNGKKILILIGPEGGFDNTELEMARDARVDFASLGRNVLRCDTAAISAIAIVNYTLDDR